MKRFCLFFSLFLSLFLFTSCQENQSVISNIDERESNEIVVYLASEGIEAIKIKGKAPEGAGAAANSEIWAIQVPYEKTVSAMALLNKQGYPRRKSTTLLELFAKSGLMSTDKEESIRYQVGLEQELAGTIRKIDGILDTKVQISFPQKELMPGQPAPKLKAAVYIKHQGVYDNPNQHLESKVKRLVSSSIEDLPLENVTIISDKATISEIKLKPDTDLIAAKARGKEYVSIWSIIMTKNSALRFRFIFFTLITLTLVFGALAGFLIYKFFPHLQSIGKKEEDKSNE